MAIVSLEKFEKLIPDEQMMVLEKMKKDMGVDGILKQWKISRGTYYKMKNKFKESLHSTDIPGNVLNQVDAENFMSDSLENLSIPEQKNLSNAQAGQKFSFAINMVGSLNPLTSTLQLLTQSQLVPSSNMRISVQIEEI
jgi:hypothetical protein